MEPHKLEKNKLKRLLQQQAILDVIVTPESMSWRRLVTYQRLAEEDCDLFKIDNGQGDHLYALFSPQGAVLKGFDHESCRSPYAPENKAEARRWIDAHYRGLPEALRDLLDEYAEGGDVTFCCWLLPGGNWRKNDVTCPACTESDDGGQAYLLNYIFSCPDDWYRWASIYYELPEEAWDAALLFYETGEITSEMIADCNPDRDYDAVIDECEDSGLFDL